MIARVDVYVFYFDLVGFAAQYFANASDALMRLRGFQREARHAFSFSSPQTYVVTVYDNVWCRVNVSQTGMPSLLMDYSGRVMSSAIAHGFPQYFGAITKGVHEFDPRDRILVGKADFEDLTVQHVDVTSEPHMRAALAEKWARHTPEGQNCVWVSSEVAAGDDVAQLSEFADSAYIFLGGVVDAREIEAGRRWPFAQCEFYPIGPRDGV